MGDYKYLSGPLPSRRFGRSLGVDLTPYKTCSLDCVFCQLGRTRKKTVSKYLGNLMRADQIRAERKKTRCITQPPATPKEQIIPSSVKAQKN